MFIKTLKLLNIFIIFPILYLLFFEIFLRLLILIFTFKTSILLYGIDNNINLSLHSIKNGEFHITNDFKVSNLKMNEIKNKNETWIFGGSTSNRGFCDSKNLSWVDLLDSNKFIKNFARNGVTSSYSLNVLKSELEKKNVPNTIIWANKVNETIHSKIKNVKSDEFYKFTNSLKLTLKSKSVVFYFFDEILIRIFDRLDVNIRYKPRELQIYDYEFSANKYYDNTTEAIKLAEKYKVKKFYIISLFTRTNINSSERMFFKYYFKKVHTLEKKYNFVEFINTKLDLETHLDTYAISPIRTNIGPLFCDPLHQTYQGKVLTAKIISKYLNDK